MFVTGYVCQSSLTPSMLFQGANSSDVWSMMTSCARYKLSASSSVLAVSLPGRMRTNLQMMFDDCANEISPPAKRDPAAGRALTGDGQVALRRHSRSPSWIVPPTSNTTIRFDALTASRNDPAPASFRLVTW